MEPGRPRPGDGHPRIFGRDCRANRAASMRTIMAATERAVTRSETALLSAALAAALHDEGVQDRHDGRGISFGPKASAQDLFWEDGFCALAIRGVRRGCGDDRLIESLAS